MKKYIIALKDNQLNMGYVNKRGNKTNIIDELVLFDDNIGHLIDTCALEVSDNLLSQLKDFIGNKESKTKHVDAVIGLESLISRTITIPYLRKKNLKDYIENNMSTFFTVNMDEYYYDYKILSINKKTKETSKTITVMIMIVPITIIKGLMNLVKTAGLKLESIRMYPDVMMNIVGNDRNIAIVDVGLNKSLVTIYEDGKVFLYTSVTAGLFGETEQEYDDFLDEIEYFTDFFSSRHKGQGLDALYIFGSYQHNQEFTDFAGKRLAIKVEHVDQHIFRKYGSEKDIEEHPQMIISQVKNKEIFNEVIDFAREERINQKEKKEFKPIYLFFILLLLTLAWSGTGYYMLNQDISDMSKSMKLDAGNIEDNGLQEEIAKASEEKELMLSQQSSLEEIAKSNVDYNDILSVLLDTLPQGVTINTISMTAQYVDVSFNIDKSTMLAVDLIVSLNNCGYFKQIDIDELELNDEVETLSFYLEFADEGVE